MLHKVADKVSIMRAKCARPKIKICGPQRLLLWRDLSMPYSTWNPLFLLK